MRVESDEPHQLVRGHARQIELCIAARETARKPLFRLDQRIDLLFKYWSERGALEFATFDQMLAKKAGEASDGIRVRLLDERAR